MRYLPLGIIGVTLAATAYAEVVREVATEGELVAAIQGAAPGTTIVVASGEYEGGLFFTELHGTPTEFLGTPALPIRIMGADTGNPPIFRGGTNGMQLSNISHVVLQDLHFTGATGNGLNIDDGGTFDSPSHHVTLRRITVTDAGPEGNRDGIKLSGVQDFLVEDCVIEHWGDAGQGVDMVGCHRGRIMGCEIRHRADVHAAGIQAKGGSRDIVIRGNVIEGTARGINIGGSTGLAFFRPEPQGYEAKDIVVEGNVFIRNHAPIAFVGVEGAVVRYNTLYRPGRWAIRILQEMREDGFVPSRNGVFTDNIVVFRSAEWAHGGVNIGPETASETFTFARNVWFCEDDADNSVPTLPTDETDGLVGVDPLLRDPAGGDFSIPPESPALGRGHTGLPG